MCFGRDFFKLQRTGKLEQLFSSQKIGIKNLKNRYAVDAILIYCMLLFKDNYRLFNGNFERLSKKRAQLYWNCFFVVNETK